MLKNAVLVMLVAVFTIVIPPSSNLMFDGIDGRYIFYTKTSVSSDFITVDSDNAKSVKKSLDYICGESVVFEFDQNIVNACLKRYSAKKLFAEQGENFNTTYYYSSKIPFYELIGGVKVNIQVAYSGTLCQIGSPIIYGGF